MGETGSGERPAKAYRLSSKGFVLSSLSPNYEGSAACPRSLFGRKKGRPLTKDRELALRSLLPVLQISPALLRESFDTDLCEIFGESFQNAWLEIGFGQGEHVSALMRQNPDTAFLAAEPFVNGMGAFLKDIQNDPHDNIRVFMNDGMIVARSLKPESLDGIYVLNPDPWHKKRHHKRRIIRSENLDVFAKILKPEGKLVMTTDVEDLAEWMITQASNHPAFEWQAESSKDWYTPPSGWIPTRYQTKGAKGAKKMVYLIFTRRGDYLKSAGV